MMVFKGRVVAPGNVTAEAVVSHAGLNTLASFQLSDAVVLSKVTEVTSVASTVTWHVAVLLPA